ncbi:hypothetical protein BTHERMOSOX_1834 [Bathymodiolus thermophilus thioautotrophic gill symbiont]|nr:hypothetical protein BTHERMOSOX_1834 [Bathymodiolus thermophilus thioautotrophic gill symbiont]
MLNDYSYLYLYKGFGLFHYPWAKKNHSKEWFFYFPEVS